MDRRTGDARAVVDLPEASAASPWWSTGWWLNLKTYGSLPAAGRWQQHTQVNADGWLRANDGLPRRGGGGKK